MQATLKNDFLQFKIEMSILIDKADTSKYTHLQNYLYFVYFPLFSYAESIIILSESGKFHSAKVLLRSLFETHINVIYYQTGDSEHKLALAAKKGFDGKLSGVKELKNLIKKYPNLESHDSANLFSNAWLDSAIEWVEEYLKGILRANNLTKKNQDPDLKAKTTKCDEAAHEKIEPGHFGRMYSVIYRQLSSPVHLNIEGLQTFVRQYNDGKYIFDDGDDGELLVNEAISICIAFVKDLYDLQVLVGQRPVILAELEDKIKAVD